MKLFTLKAIIDDILLIVRNSNISESEDLSRALIELWIHLYRAVLIRLDKQKRRDIDPTYTLVLGPLKLEKIPINTIDVSLKNEEQNYKYKTIEPIPKPVDFPFGNGIISVTDLLDCTILKMSKNRRHFQWLRKTGREYTYYYQPDYIYVQGRDALRYIYVTGIFEDPTESGLTEDETYPIPADKVGALKLMIFNNELKFMLQLPSDDKDNASLSGVKPLNNE